MEVARAALQNVDQRVFTFMLAHVAMITGNIVLGINTYLQWELVTTYQIWPVTFNFVLNLCIVPFHVFWTSLFPSSWGGGWRPIASRRDVGLMLCMGVFGFAISQVLFSVGMLRVGPKVAACYAPLQTMFTAMFAVFPWRYERPSKMKAAGLVVGLVGMLVSISGVHEYDHILQDWKKTFSREYVKGNLLLLCGALSGSMFFLWQKPLMKKYSTGMVLSITYLTAVSVQLGIEMALHTGNFGLAKLTSAPIHVASCILCTGVGLRLMFWGSQYMDASITAGYSVFQTTTCYFIGAFRSEMRPPFQDYIAVALLLLGVAMLSSRNQNQRAEG